MTTPNWFLIIGAQKSGTTTLFRDLSLLDSVDLPDLKERGWFNDDAILRDRARRDLDASYTKAKATHRGDVSTSYSKRDEFVDVPQRVRQVLGPDVKLVYLLRNPIDRAVSHHHYESGLGLLPGSFPEALANHPSVLDNGRYGHQLEPWLEQFPLDQILLVDFHHYAANRAVGLATVTNFLGIDEAVEAGDELAVVHNPTSGRPSPTGLASKILMSKPYLRAKRYIPASLRSSVAGSVLSVADERPPGPDTDAIEAMKRVFDADFTVLASLVGDDEATRLSAIWRYEDFGY